MIVITSIIRSFYNLAVGNLWFPEQFCGKILQMEDGLKFKIFRHMRLRKKTSPDAAAIFIVRFKFKKFSHRTNMKASRIPIPLIAGFPGFRDKVWMIDPDTDYWQGVYQWENVQAIEKYKKSFVLAIMNKRALKNSISYKTIPGISIEDYLLSVAVD